MHTRRVFFSGVFVTGFMLAAPAWAAVEAGVRGAPIPRGEAGKVLSAAQAAFVDSVSDLIIPRTTTPGASDVGVVGFIDNMLAGFVTPAEREQFLSGLDQLMQLASANEQALVSIVAAQDEAAFASKEKSFWRELKQLVVLGYCTSEPGATQLLEYLPVPGGFKPSIAVTATTRNYAT